MEAHPDQYRQPARRSVSAATPFAQISRWRVVPALGIVQIVAWGSTYYLPAVISAPLAADTGWPLPLIVGGLSLALLTSGLCSPLIGHLIDRRGGRPVLVAGSLAISAGLAALGSAQAPAMLLIAWAVIGMGMSASLYDAVFSALGRLYGKGGRSAITQLTLLGGFASTACWPLSTYLVETVGWRGTCLAYALLHLTICVPVLLLVLPREQSPPAAARPISPDAVQTGTAPVSREGATVRLLAAILMTGGVISTLIAAHLITLLQESGIAPAMAVFLGMLIGPAQVCARLVEMAFGFRYHPIWTLTSAILLIGAGVVLLALNLSFPAFALILYGVGSGIWSIARGTLPLTLFGSSRYPIFMGRLALPALMAQAAAPLIGAATLDYGGTPATFGFLIALAALNVALVAGLWSFGRA